jgi:hypothetical protein
MIIYSVMVVLVLDVDPLGIMVEDEKIGKMGRWQFTRALGQELPTLK